MTWNAIKYAPDELWTHFYFHSCHVKSCFVDVMKIYNRFYCYHLIVVEMWLYCNPWWSSPFYFVIKTSQVENYIVFGWVADLEKPCIKTWLLSMKALRMKNLAKLKSAVVKQNDHNHFNHCWPSFCLLAIQ